MSEEREKEESECMLTEPSGGEMLDVGGNGSASVIEKDPIAKQKESVPEEIPPEVDMSKNAAEEIKKEPNGKGCDVDGNNVEQTGNFTEDGRVGGATTVKEEKSNSVDLKVENGETFSDTKVKEVQSEENHFEETPAKQDTADGEYPVPADGLNRSFFLNIQSYEGDGSGTEEEQTAFMKELEIFHKEMSLEFKPPKFYGEGLNCLKLWRAVTRLGGYDQVTSCKLWRQVGESFHPPKTCTTVSWSFRCFYEKALLEYEKHKIRTGELQINVSSPTEHVSVENQVKSSQPSGSGRTIRDAAARAMQGWHSQRLLGNGGVGDPIIKDKSATSLPKRDKQPKSVGGNFKRKKASSLDRFTKFARPKVTDPQMDTMVVDVGPPADWVKINVRKTKDCFEVYALVPGLLREEVHVQSDPAGRLVISGEPEQLDNPWGVTPFKKIVTLPSRIDPHQTSAVVTLHGQLFVRAPFEQPDQ